ncbi:MAG: hypothetical protein IPM34_00390 [Saprospiraceae bacterium]|nr:hypothetical protein [Saprospiraceae bacterium]
MTLQQFFNWIQENPMMILYYFALIFLFTILLNTLAENKGQLYPWNWMYSIVLYLVCIPGIFAITLNIYFFLFEKRSIMETELLLQIFPVFMMFAIIYFIRKNVQLGDIPGFERLSGLMWIISILLCLMWVIDRTHLYAISFVPFYYVLIFLMISIFLLRYFSRSLSK